MEEKVQTYINTLSTPQKEICKEVRKIILKTFPDIEESFEFGVPWYEGKLYIVGLSDHVNIGFSIKGLRKDELKAFNGKGKLIRQIKLYSLNDIDEDRIVKLLKVIN